MFEGLTLGKISVSTVGGWMAPYRTRPLGFRVRVKGPSQQILSLGIIAKGLFRV
jgi:hypothetical protein